MRISCLFKPQKSGVAWELQKNWFYEIRYNELVTWKKIVKSRLKILVAWVTFDKIADLYEEAHKYFNKDAVVVFMTPISQLFES